jgi:Bacteriophage CI repressor helix-turn-helix domain
MYLLLLAHPIGCVNKKEHTLGCYVDFSGILSRIKNETEIKTLTGLAKFLNTTQQYVSKRKAKNDFPVKWAFKIGREYGLLTEWIMTGEGIKSLDEQNKQQFRNPILNDVDEWLTEQIQKEPFRKDWFEGNLLDEFPSFSDWRNKKDSKNEK